MTSIKEIRQAVKVNLDDMSWLADVLLAILDHIEDGRMHKEPVVPAEWYRSAVHSHLKVYRELLALGQVVNGQFDSGSLLWEKQREILAADPEYQRLVAEETPRLAFELGSLAADGPKPKCYASQPNVDYATAECCTFDVGHGGQHSWAPERYAQQGSVKTVLPTPSGDTKLADLCLAEGPLSVCGYIKNHTSSHAWEQGERDL